MDSYYDQPEEFYCDNCEDRVPTYEYNDGLCDYCEQVRKEDNAED